MPRRPLATRCAMSDEMRASRPSQAEMEATAQRPAPAQPDAQFADLMAKLRQAVAEGAERAQA